MSGKRSRNKGKRGELEVAKFATQHGYPGRRGRQYQGTPESPDVIIEGWPGCHVEVKRSERLNIYEAMEQCNRDAGPENIAEVWWRKNNKPWLVIVSAEDLMLYKDAYYGTANGKQQYVRAQHFPPPGE